MKRKCWIYSCWRDAVGVSRFCATHGWNHKGTDHVPPPEKPVKK